MENNKIVKRCKWCNILIECDNIKQFGAHLTNCRMNPAKLERDLKSKKSKEYKLICKCNKEYSIEVTEHQYNKGNYKKFCSRTCANSRVHTDESKNKISMSIKSNITYKPLKTYVKTCLNCNLEFENRRRTQTCCSRNCNMIYRNKMDKNLSSKAGRKSVHSQQRRSKNEALFSEYCKTKFSNVLDNEPMFNGWDADIIIVDIKVAIMWNGIWHYEKMFEGRDMKKVTERDLKKLEEVINSGYTPYVIKDMGDHSKEKVEMEWRLFNLWLDNKNVTIN